MVQSSLKSALKKCTPPIINVLRRTPIPYTWAGPAKTVVENFRQWLPQKALAKDIQIHPIHPPSSFQFKRRKDLPWELGNRRSLDFPPTFVLEAANYSLRTWGSGNILTKKGELLREFSPTFAKNYQNHTALNLIKFPKLIRGEGSVAQIATISPENYYHWILDSLPRAHLVEKSGLTPERWVVANQSPFQKKTLEQLNIPVACQIQANAHLHLCPQSFIIPSLTSHIGRTPQWAIEYLRERFLPVNQGKPIGKIFIQRGDVNYRKVTNEPQLIEFLKERDFEIYNPGADPIEKQIRKFNEAKYILAPHGAALTNIVFCNPDCRILEIFSPLYVNGCYYNLASLMDLEYHAFLGKGPRNPEGTHAHEVGANIDVDLNELASRLDL